MRIVIFSLLLSLNFSLRAETLTQQLAKKKAQSKKKGNSQVKKEFKRAIDDLRRSGIEENSLKVGQRVPGFSLNGKSIRSFYKEGPVILKFYRGGWCPYCLLELQAYQKHLSDFKKLGATLIVLAPDTDKEIAKTKRRFKLSFPIYSDTKNQIADKFGIKFKLDAKVEKIYQKFGIDLKEAQENSEFTLPMPGTYIIDRTGKVIFAFADADYTVRVDPLTVLKELKKL